MSLPVRETLKSLRIEILREEGDELWALCPGHKKKTGRVDHNPSWSINAKTGIHYCFSCHHSGNLYTLVRDQQGEPAARQFLTEIETFGRAVSTTKKTRRPMDRQARRSPTGDWFPDSWLGIYGYPPDEALRQRRLIRQAVEAYGVRWDYQREAWVFPIRNADHRLIGYQVKAQKGRYFRNYPRDMVKSTALFGIDVAKEDVVVVESPLDAVRLYGLGYDAVAICGSRISEEQLDLLRQYNNLTLALDNDSAGAKEHKRLRKNLIKAHTIRYTGPEKDVGEMTDAAIQRAMGER